MLDEELIKRLLLKDGQALALLIQRHTRRYYHVAWGILLNQEDAEDVVQDCFVKLFENPSLYDPERGAKFTTWFSALVVNRSIDYRRSLLRWPKFLFSREDPPTERLVEHHSMRKDLLSALKLLPKNQRAALTLFYREDIPQKEIAEMLNLSVKAVEGLLQRGKTGLREQLSHWKEENYVDVQTNEKSSV